MKGLKGKRYGNGMRYLTTSANCIGALFGEQGGITWQSIHVYHGTSIVWCWIWLVWHIYYPFIVVHRIGTL